GRLNMPAPIPPRLMAVLTGDVMARATAGALLLVMLVHAVETAKFITARTRCTCSLPARYPIRHSETHALYHRNGSLPTTTGSHGPRRRISCPCSWHRNWHRRGWWWIRRRIISGFPARRRRQTKQPTVPSRCRAAGSCACMHACIVLASQRVHFGRGSLPAVLP